MAVFVWPGVELLGFEICRALPHFCFQLDLGPFTEFSVPVEGQDVAGSPPLKPARRNQLPGEQWDGYRSVGGKGNVGLAPCD